MLGLQDSVTKGAVPVPATDSRTLGFFALLMKVSVAELLPAVLGAKATFSGRLWPASMVSGKEAPAIANWALLLAAEEIVTLPPVALRVEVCVVDVPSSTLPKFTEVGERLSCPIVVPVPVKGMFRRTPE